MARLKVAQQEERNAIAHAQQLSAEVEALAAALADVQTEAGENAARNAELVAQVQSLQAR